MEKLFFLISMVIAVSLSGCTSECSDCGCDDCGESGSGNLELIRDWSALLPDMERPEEVDVYLYHPELSPRHEVTYSDVSRYDVAPGRYEVLAVNRQDAALFRGMDNYYTAEVCLPTYTLDSCTVVGEAPLILCDRTSVEVENGQSRCTVMPAPFIKTINFTIKVHRQGDVGEITMCHGRLGGVLTSAKLDVGRQDGFSASLDFTPKKESTDVFKKSVTLLGVNPDVSHNLKLELTDESGMVRKAETDVGKLDFSDTSVLNCHIELNITGTGMEVGIVDWEPGGVGDIVLQ